jgi:hypothetical protein
MTIVDELKSKIDAARTRSELIHVASEIESHKEGMKPIPGYTVSDFEHDSLRSYYRTHIVNLKKEGVL